jgi:hypothetical protein
LFTEISESVILNLDMGFNTSNCGESPATSTFCLILDWGHTSYKSPVPMCWNLFQLEFLINSLFMSGWAILRFAYNSEVIIELLVSHVTVHVKSFFPSVFWILIVLDNLLQFGLKNFLSLWLKFWVMTAW